MTVEHVLYRLPFTVIPGLDPGIQAQARACAHVDEPGGVLSEQGLEPKVGYPADIVSRPAGTIEKSAVRSGR